MTERDDALKELGRVVTERREDLGMTLESVFDRTKIRLEYLRGIENGDYKNFPELVYIKGFVRTYLKLIDAEDVQEEFMAQLDRAFTHAPKRQSDPRQTKKNITNMMTTIAKRILIIGSLNVSLNSSQNVVGSESGITFEPFFSLDSLTSLSVNPLNFIHNHPPPLFLYQHLYSTHHEPFCFIKPTLIFH